ncbi:MAG: hypothetical protein R3212_09310, partial [Xanthomonadales bacterium]|nr:hypothetical protein [Xanthomonadales bacterium]
MIEINRKIDSLLALCFVFFVATAIIAGCARNAELPPSDWVTATERDHPLTGRLWQVESKSFVEPKSLLVDLDSADIVLIGEKHDN